MALNNTSIAEQKAYETDIMENLTVNDVLLFLAVCATKEKTDMDAKQIVDEENRWELS